MKLILVLIVTIEQFVLYRLAFNLGVQREKRARLRRLNALRKLIRTRE